VCLEEEALGVFSPRSRAAAAEFSGIREKGCASSSTAMPLSGMDQGDSLPYW
jgi:hypothetical protein